MTKTRTEARESPVPPGRAYRTVTALLGQFIRHGQDSCSGRSVIVGTAVYQWPIMHGLQSTLRVSPPVFEYHTDTDRGTIACLNILRRCHSVVSSSPLAFGHVFAQPVCRAVRSRSDRLSKLEYIAAMASCSRERERTTWLWRISIMIFAAGHRGCWVLTARP